jgi:hypothetical protein
LRRSRRRHFAISEWGGRAHARRLPPPPPPPPAPAGRRRTTRRSARLIGGGRRRRENFPADWKAGVTRGHGNKARGWKIYILVVVSASGARGALHRSPPLDIALPPPPPRLSPRHAPPCVPPTLSRGGGWVGGRVGATLSALTALSLFASPSRALRGQPQTQFVYFSIHFSINY